MSRITIRVPEEMLEQVDDDRGDETSRSEWFRNAARSELGRDDRDELREEIEILKQRLNQVEEQASKPFWRKWKPIDFNNDPRIEVETEVTEMTDEELQKARERIENAED